MKELLPRLALSIPPSGLLEPWAAFGPMRRSVWLEIGFGGGEHLVHHAARHPEVGLIGCEMFENGIAKLLVQIDRLQLGNIRVFPNDVRLLLGALPPASIDRVFILFPDPWPKRRHAGRRIVTRATLDALAVIMTDNAELRLATDDRNYLRWMLERATDHPAFDWLARRAGDWRERPQDWPPTRYEEKARAIGRTPAFLSMRRCAR
jgi:tRNA (guanine-N7-)-methyltransferase